MTLSTTATLIVCLTFAIAVLSNPVMEAPLLIEEHIQL